MNLKTHTDRILADELPASIRRLLDQAMAQGADQDALLDLLRSVGRGRTLLVLAAEAYLGAACDHEGEAD